jgi:hypothetical protein
MALGKDIRKMKGAADPLAAFRGDAALMEIKTADALAEAITRRHEETTRDTKRLLITHLAQPPGIWFKP